MMGILHVIMKDHMIFLQCTTMHAVYSSYTCLDILPALMCHKCIVCNSLSRWLHRIGVGSYLFNYGIEFHQFAIIAIFIEIQTDNFDQYSRNLFRQNVLSVLDKLKKALHSIYSNYFSSLKLHLCKKNNQINAL